MALERQENTHFTDRLQLLTPCPEWAAGLQIPDAVRAAAAKMGTPNKKNKKKWEKAVEICKNK